jgi:poly(3-hydroxybutyrate) depolymerase
LNVCRRAAALVFTASLIAASGNGAQAQGAAVLQPGSGAQVAVLSGRTLNVATYRPKSCSPRILLVVFHGVDRNAETYRDRARPLADKLCAVMIAPEFNYSDFPRNLYAYGGLEDHGHMIEAGSRTVDFVQRLIGWAQSGLEKRDLPHVLVGHSAGGQFLSRVAAYTDTRAAHIVVANPSSWVMASTTDAVPFGFGGFKEAGDAEQAMKLYLARPVIVALGRQDTGSKELDQSIEAQRQGKTRYARGTNAYNTAKAAAAAHGWPFNWTLIEVDGVGHSSTQMMNAAQTVSALR